MGYGYQPASLLDRDLKSVGLALWNTIGNREQTKSVILEPAAIKRLVEPEEVASLVVCLCSPAADAVIGAAWTIDLGWTAR